MTVLPFRRVVHCDWSVAPGKRWLACADEGPDGWRVSAPVPVGDTLTLLDRLRADSDGALLVGFDLPIGVPSHYGQQLPFRNFPEALRAFGTGAWADMFTVAPTPGEIALHRPFYPARGAGAKRQHLVEGLGAPTWEALMRRCERGTGDRGPAGSLFWTVVASRSARLQSPAGAR